jgi:hypothetical protein
MPAYTVNANGTTAVVNGTRPFVKAQTGGPNGALGIVDAGGVNADPRVGGQTGQTVFADSQSGEDKVDAIVTAANNSPVNTVAPVITGTAQVGQTLTTTGGTFTGTAAPTKTYQWKRGGVAISGATASTYVCVLADLAALITVTVTGTNTHGVATGTSAATAAVIAA